MIQNDCHIRCMTRFLFHGAVSIQLTSVCEMDSELKEKQRKILKKGFCRESHECDKCIVQINSLFQLYAFTFLC